MVCCNAIYSSMYLFILLFLFTHPVSPILSFLNIKQKINGCYSTIFCEHGSEAI